jgi:hypothetical protein
MVDTEATTPYFRAELMNQLLCGDPWTLGTGCPFGLRQKPLGGIPEGAFCRNQQYRVGRDGKGGSRLDGGVAMHLRLADAEQGLLISEVDLTGQSLPIFEVG